jgi:hypothetical protein
LHRDEISRGRAKSGPKGSTLSLVAVVLEDSNLRVATLELLSDLEASIARAIVDDDNLQIQVLCAQGQDPFDTRLQRPFLVEAADDDGERSRC